MHGLSYLFVFIFLGSCAIDRTMPKISHSEKASLIDFQSLSDQHTLNITEEDEPGRKLFLCLSFINKATKSPLINQEVKFYHTSAAGHYEPTDPRDEATARLNGTAKTNLNGKILVKTILPGDYGSSSDNRHIHTTVFGAQPEAYDIHFKQYTGTIGRNFVKGSDQHFLADLKRTEDEVLVAFITLEVKKPAQE